MVAGPCAGAGREAFGLGRPVATKLSCLLSYYTNESWSYFPVRSSPDQTGARLFYTHLCRRYGGLVTTTAGELGSEASITAIAALGDDQRRRLFGYIRHAHRPVTREEAAADAGISRKLAAHHLDKLVTAGLLSARYQPPAGVRKVGRAPKVYELAGAGIGVSIPERRHEVQRKNLCFGGVD